MAGNTEIIDRIQSDNELSKLPIGWALRFDSINDPHFQKYFKDKKNVGLLLEITPQLASASGVVYKGKQTGEDWYLARNAFLIGYTVNERKKLIDTVFKAFNKTFGYYPLFTVSWMIDADSLAYIYKVYGVMLHELTREQYETDSYTLYGGIFNAPYYPSLDHPLIPAKAGDLLPVVIVRQTISDLTYNYGTQKAVYTSQPNDYLSSPETNKFEYFQNRIDEAVNQSSLYRLGVVGFENSFKEKKFQDEFNNQLTYLKKLSETESVQVTSAADYAQKHLKDFPTNRAFWLSNIDKKSEGKAYWYFSPNYRARILYRDGKLILTDLRSYARITDPYKDTPVSVDYAYWIAPYLIDGSQMFSGKSNESVANDVLGNPFGIVLGKGDFTVKEQGETLLFSDNTSGNTIQFTPQVIAVDASFNLSFTEPIKQNFASILQGENDVNIDFLRHPKFIAKYQDGEVKLGWHESGNDIALFGLRQENSRYLLYPKDKIENFGLLAPIFQPDKSLLPFEPLQSIFYWHNQDAIAGRNPIRLFVLPRNKYQRPAKIENIEFSVVPNDGISTLFPDDYSYRLTPWYIDIEGRDPIRAKVSLFVDDTPAISQKEIVFVRDCVKQIAGCIRNPVSVIEFTLTRAKEFFRTLQSRLTLVK